MGLYLITLESEENKMRDFIKKLNESKRELEKYSEEKIEFVRKCREEVIKYEIEKEERLSKGFWLDDCYSSSEIIRDYKCECMEDEIMSEEEFDKIYELIDFISIESAMTVC